MTDLVLGPLLRHVDSTSATVWVQTSAPCTVEVAGCTAETFQVDGHFFALVVVTGLRPGTSTPYEVRLDGDLVWPLAGSALPPSRIRTTAEGQDFALVFGSCRMPESDDPDERAMMGTDALAAYARRMIGQDSGEWPDSLVLLGDQVYADETSKATRSWLGGRRSIQEPPGTGAADFEEYVHLYHEAWSTSLVRWLMSTVPTSMMFDDHDVIDDWNTSLAWRTRIESTSWWAEREIGGLVSYWVYQHLGNLHPDELATDDVYAKVRAVQDGVTVLRDLARTATREVNGRRAVRWSYRRDFGRVRLLMVDTRAGRILSSGERAMVSDNEFEWLEANAEGDYDHLLIGSSLPWLMPHAISYLQSMNEVACGKPGWRGRFAEKIRQAGDLEHWPAFRASADRLTRLIRRAAEGTAATVSVLSGDVHHVYTAKASFDAPVNASVYQLVCSPVHNRIPRMFVPLFRLGWSKPFAAAVRSWMRLPWISRRVAPMPVDWAKLDGPFVGNAVATLRIAGRKADVVVEHATGDNELSPMTSAVLS